jgi:DNA repair exonuclease SbcCD ATPase subunit
MNLANILTRKDPLKKAFVTLEDGMTDVLNEEFMLPPEPETASPGSDETEAVAAGNDELVDELAEQFDAELSAEFAAEAIPAEAIPAEAVPAAEENSERLTSHTQNRLAGLAAVDEARNKIQQDLTQLSTALSNIVASQNLSREFLDDCYADIRRANELEIMNANYAAENRRLGDRVDKLEKLRARYDQLIEVLKRREGRLMIEAEDLRESLSSAKLEAVEAKNAIARAEFVQGELHTSLAAKSNEAERYMRENEMLREKNVNIALDLDKALQRQAETRRKFEDLAAVHASESALVAKTTAKLASEEKEAARLQKLSDMLEARLVEANEHIAGFKRDMDEREELYQSENHALKGEIQTLLSRLNAGVAEQAETVSELTALKTRLNELESEKQFAERKYAGLAAEVDSERKQAARDGSGEHEEVDGGLNAQQAEAMRQQIEELTKTVQRLKRYEKLAKVRSKTADFPNTFGVKPKAKNGFRPKLAAG